MLTSSTDAIERMLMLLLFISWLHFPLLFTKQSSVFSHVTKKVSEGLVDLLAALQL